MLQRRIYKVQILSSVGTRRNLVLSILYCRGSTYSSKTFFQTILVSSFLEGFLIVTSSLIISIIVNASSIKNTFFKLLNDSLQNSIYIRSCDLSKLSLMISLAHVSYLCPRRINVNNYSLSCEVARISVMETDGIMRSHMFLYLS